MEDTNQEEMQLVPKPDQSPITYEGPSIPEEVYQEILDYDDSAVWLKFNNAGFYKGDNPSPERYEPRLVGVIREVRFHWLKFGEPGSPSPPEERDDLTPEEARELGFEKRGQIKVATGGYFAYALNMAPSSCRRLSAYTKHLEERKMRLEQVITEIEPQKAKGRFGLFDVLTFKCVGVLTDVFDGDIPF